MVIASAKTEKLLKPELLGEVQLAHPISQRVMTLSILVVVLATFGFVFFGTYSRHERVVGLLAPRAGLVQLNANSSGIVSTVFVTQGELVGEDAPLLAISSDRASAAYGKTDNAIASQLRIERDQLDTDVRNLDLLEERKLAANKVLTAALVEEVSEATAQVATQRKQAANARGLLEKISPLAAVGYLSILQAKQLEREMLQAEAQEMALRSQRIDVQQRLYTARQEREQIPLIYSEQRHELQRRRADIEQALARIELQKASVVRSPRLATVSAILYKTGQRVEAGSRVISLVPADAVLIAEILVPSRAIGFVELNSPVRLRYQSYPYQIFGVYGGRVSGISGNALSPADVLALQGTTVTESMYRVDVALSSQTVFVSGTERHLKPGMSVEAEFVLHKQTLLQLLIGSFPTHDGAGRAPSRA